MRRNARLVSWKVLLPLFAIVVVAALPWIARAIDYLLVDTGQTKCYDNAVEITCSATGQPFYGQDAQYDGSQPSYTLSGDGLTVYDNHTGLTWTQSPDLDGDSDIDADDKLTWTEFQTYPATLNAESYGGYSDWRLPTIKELYSLIDFSGIDPSGWSGSDTSGLVPFIDTAYFDFAYGDTSAGERIIDAQYWSSTEYVGTTMGGIPTTFGVNFADGRIKGYGREFPGGGEMTQFVRCVRGNTDYGVNSFADNGDGTVTDLATGLMWMQDDSGAGYNWEDALDYAENLSFAGYDDWYLPNAKELQSIVDYTRSPSTTGSAAIDTIFNTTSIIDEGGGTNYPFYWTGTTHVNWTETPGQKAAYVAFGEALGWMQQPPPAPPGTYVLQDVHGAGAQRSDPKTGDPANWPYGNGPQGDVVRIFNYVRAVRTPDAAPTPTPTATATPTATPTSTPTPTPPPPPHRHHQRLRRRRPAIAPTPVPGPGPCPLATGTAMDSRPRTKATLAPTRRTAAASTPGPQTSTTTWSSTSWTWARCCRPPSAAPFLPPARAGTSSRTASSTSWTWA